MMQSTFPVAIINWLAEDRLSAESFTFRWPSAITVGYDWVSYLLFLEIQISRSNSPFLQNWSWKIHINKVQNTTITSNTVVPKTVTLSGPINQAFSRKKFIMAPSLHCLFGILVLLRFLRFLRPKFVNFGFLQSIWMMKVKILDFYGKICENFGF